MKPELALSIRQPWAFLICKGYKDIENRDWRVPSLRLFALPKRIYIHAGLKPDEDAVSQAGWMWIKERLTTKTFGEIYGYTWKELLTFGAIIGEVDITDCVTDSESPWFEGEYGFTLANAVLYENPIPCRGQLGFFRPNISSEVAHE